MTPSFLLKSSAITCYKVCRPTNTNHQRLSHPETSQFSQSVDAAMNANGVLRDVVHRLTKCHTAAYYMNECNFLHSHRKNTILPAPPFTKLINNQQYFTHVSHTNYPNRIKIVDKYERKCIYTHNQSTVFTEPIIIKLIINIALWTFAVPIFIHIGRRTQKVQEILRSRLQKNYGFMVFTAPVFTTLTISQWHVEIAFHPSLSRNIKIAYLNQFTFLSKLRLLLHRFSRSSRLQDNF